MSDHATIMIKKKSIDNLDEQKEGYYEGFLVNAEQKGISTVELTIEDKETGDQYVVEEDHMAAILGSCKRYIDPDEYEDLDALETEEVAETILDTRDSGLRFYYYRPNANPA